MKPAIIQAQDGTMTYQNKVLLHTISALPNYRIEDEHLVLLGVVYVRPNSSFYSLQLTDTRSRGGGLIDKISDEIRREIEPDSDFYWDIGYWDGEAYPENAVILLRLDRRILQEYGGRFTDDEVQVAVNKHVAYGTLILVEYVETISEFKLQNLNVDVEPLNRLDYKPVIFADTDLDHKPEILSIETVSELDEPWLFTLETTEDNYKPGLLDVWTDKPESDLVDLSIDRRSETPIAELVDVQELSIVFNPSTTTKDNTSTTIDYPIGDAVTQSANFVLELLDLDKPETPSIDGEEFEPFNPLAGYIPDIDVSIINEVTPVTWRPEISGFEIIDDGVKSVVLNKPDIIIDTIIE